MSETPRRPWLWVQMGCVPYPDALALQRGLVQARISGRLAEDVWLILEHPPVYTLGRRGGRQNLIVPRRFLEERKIPVIPVERGGDITYHGPGQIVGYPIIDLRRAGMGVRDYVEGLEELMLRTAACWGVIARRDPRNRGVWVGERKIGSVGIHVRRRISFHGFAFNVNPSLTPFEWMHPCGLRGVGVTSLAAESAAEIDPAAVRAALRQAAARIFNVRFRSADSAGLPSTAVQVSEPQQPVCVHSPPSPSRPCPP